MSALNQLALVPSIEQDLKKPLAIADIVAAARLPAPDIVAVENFESALANKNRQIASAQESSEDDIASYTPGFLKEHAVAPIPKDLSAAGILAFQEELDIKMLNYQIGGYFFSQSAKNINDLIKTQ